MEETIAAISTPPGKGAVSMIRVSGETAFQVCDSIFVGKKQLKDAPPYSMVYGKIQYDGKVIDQVLCGVFHHPSSFTGEDTVEIYCHGGVRNTQLVLEAALHSGARMANRGEFSKRAFLNGKMDLSQAEAVIDLIQSDSAYAVYQSAGQLEGGISHQLNALRERLVAANAKILAVIDFPDEDLEEWERDAFFQELEQVKQEIVKALKGFQKGRIVKEGLRTLLIGKTNVGKSSLLNLLLKTKKAIVTDIEGTTRDMIEDQLEIKGLLIRLTDTAGIRESKDQIEQIGVAMTKEMIPQSDLILWVMDGSRPFDQNDAEIEDCLQGKKVIYIKNKCDLPSALTVSYSLLPISCKTGEGLDELYDAIYQVALEEQPDFQESTFFNNLRHKQCLERALQNIEDALAGRELPLDMISIDLTDACRNLGEITGLEVSEDTVAHIFADFCVGK